MRRKLRTIVISLTTVVTVLWAIASFLEFQSVPQIEEGRVSGAKTEPGGLVPEDILLPPNFEILSSSRTKEASQLTLKTSMDLERLFRFYEESGAVLGWSPVGTASNKGFRVLTFEKPGKRLEVSLTEDLNNGFTIVSLTY